MNTGIVIPARIASTRFPNKMLAELNGVPLIKHVYDICASTGFETYVLTDSEEIAKIVPSKLTSEADNGTERCALKAIEIGWDTYINVQGDMPDITPQIIAKVALALETNHVVTAYTDMNPVDRANPDSVKLIHNENKAHWFCRASLEYGDHHLGVYGYSRAALLEYMNLKKTKEEEIEKLEQLRWLQNNIDIAVVKVEFDGIEINTPEDLEEWHNKNYQSKTY